MGVLPSLLPMQMGGAAASSIPALVAHASLFSKAVLLVLVALSVYSWAILWDRLRLYAKVRAQDEAFLIAFRGVEHVNDMKMIALQHPVSVLAQAALAGQKASDQHAGESVTARFELVQRAMDRAADDATTQLERRVGFLATTGSATAKAIPRVKCGSTRRRSRSRPTRWIMSSTTGRRALPRNVRSVVQTFSPNGISMPSERATRARRNLPFAGSGTRR